MENIDKGMSGVEVSEMKTGHKNKSKGRGE